MRNYTKNIIDYSDGNLSEKMSKRFEKMLMINNTLREKYNFFRRINVSMRGKIDHEEAQNDPDRVSIDPMTRQMVLNFHENPTQFTNIQQFIGNAMASCDSPLQRQIDNAKYEAEALSINETTAEWVDEWNADNHNLDLGFMNRKAFISNSLSDENCNSIERKKRRSNTFAYKLAGFAAAAMISLFLIVNTLIPSDSPESVYNKFYKPLNVYYISYLRKNDFNNVARFIDAVDMYRQAQYSAAAAEFSGLMLKEANTIFSFFSGITQLELGDNDRAISQLNEVVSNNGDFKKEAQWYLGLTYLKTGEISKAKSLFIDLSETEGYYKDQAQDLLNHL